MAAGGARDAELIVRTIVGTALIQANLTEKLITEAVDQGKENVASDMHNIMKKLITEYAASILKKKDIYHLLSYDEIKGIKSEGLREKIMQEWQDGSDSVAQAKHINNYLQLKQISRLIGKLRKELSIRLRFLWAA